MKIVDVLIVGTYSGWLLVAGFIAGRNERAAYRNPPPIALPKTDSRPPAIRLDKPVLPDVMLLSNPDDQLLVYAGKWPLPDGTWIVKCDETYTKRRQAFAKEAQALADKCNCPMLSKEKAK